MYLTAMSHRDELFDLTLRWMNDDLKPDDGERISRIFVYESAISTIVIDRIIDFLGRLYKSPLQLERIRQKQALRERIITYAPGQTPRMHQLAEEYLQNSKYFFPYLPIDAALITGSGPRLFAVGRIKRLCRVAEKVSFRLVDALFKEIQTNATRIAEKRAAVAGVPLDAFISSKMAMHNDFIEAEEVVARRFKDRNVIISPESMKVNDIIGFKIIDQPEMLDRIPQLLDQEEGIHVVEIEKHSGDYNAVNILLDIDLPDRNVLTGHLLKVDWNSALLRGLRPDDISRNISSYVEEGATSIRMEIILTTYEELMEAEFGRSMHELRILRLRQRQAYCGPLGQNAGYLIEYLLELASSPTVSVTEIPIKMYGRYLPESIAALKGALYGNIVDDGLLSTFCLQQNQLANISTGSERREQSNHALSGRIL